MYLTTTRARRRRASPVCPLARQMQPGASGLSFTGRSPMLRGHSNSATIGGVAATIHAQTTTGPTSAQLDTGIAIISALVPTGTTAAVALTFNNTVARTSLGIYRAINEVNASPHATMTDNTLSSNVNSGTINIPGTGMLVAGSTAATTAGQANTWTGATETVDTPHPNAAGILNMEGSETGLWSSDWKNPYRHRSRELRSEGYWQR